MKSYRLEIDPRILELLGPNLYTNIYYVLAELIANAYDADARNVYIDASASEIRVEDDGKGMSYERGDVNRYLNVAGVSRSTAEDSLTGAGRKKMGRKGVGKLAALAVSERVRVLTVASGEKSGFILDRNPQNGHDLVSIPDSDVTFDHIAEHGSAIIMQDPQYTLHKTMRAIRRNILKMFPIVGSDFRIHVKAAGESGVIDSFDESAMGELSTLVTLGDRFSHLTKLVSNPYPAARDDLVSARAPVNLTVTLEVNGEPVDHELEIIGWIGTYKSTRGRKAELTDFPDNFISIFANGKLGEFNILPMVGQNKLSEVYIVGQLHVDLFELTELPDMALSNRQGYKSDDPRYARLLEYVRADLLAEVRRRRDQFVNLENSEKKRKKLEAQEANEAALRESVNQFRRNFSDSAAQALREAAPDASVEDIAAAVASSLTTHAPELGLKAIVDSQKKRILISQTYSDKSLADVVYNMLLFNNVPADDILYTNCDDEVCRIPEGESVFGYLRKFFVESYSTQGILVLFITSENTKASWGAISEVGASWITRINHKIFNIRPFKPELPLDNAAQWQNTLRDSASGELSMDKINADILCQKIESSCNELGYKSRSRAENMSHLDSLVTVQH